MSARPTTSSKFLASKQFHPSLDIRPLSRDFIGLSIEAIDPMEFSDIKPPSNAFRPMTCKAAIKSSFQKPFNFQIKSPTPLMKTVSSPKEEKVPIPLGTFQFKNFLPPANESDIVRFSLGSNRKGIGSTSYRGLEPNDFQSRQQDADAMANGEKSGNSGMVAFKKESPEDLSPGGATRTTAPDTDKYEDASNNMVRSTGSESFKAGLSGAKTYSVALASPRKQQRKYLTLSTKLGKASSLPKSHTKEDETNLNSIQDFEENLYSERYFQSKDKEIRKPKDQPLSQAMFRMKEFKRAKEFVLNKKKASMNPGTETSMKPLSHRLITNLKLFDGDSPCHRENNVQGSKDWKSEAIKTLEKDGQELAGEEMDRQSMSRSNFANAYMESDKKGNYVLSPVKRLSETTKAIENDKEKRELGPYFSIMNNEDKSVKIWDSDKLIKKKPFDTKGDLVVKRDLSVGVTKGDKFDMKMFFKSNGMAGSQSIAAQILIKKPTEENYAKSPKYNERKIERFDQRSQQQQKIIGQKFANKVVGNNINIQKIRVVSKSPVELKSKFLKQTGIISLGPKDSPKGKQSERLRRFVDKDYLTVENTNKNRKRNASKPLVEIEELSKISIKQFEVSESWEYDNLDMMKQTSKEQFQLISAINSIHLNVANQ